MRAKILAATLTALSCVAMAQDAGVAEKTKTMPATKLEAFSAQTGIVMVKGYTTIAVVSSGMGKVTVEAQELRDASNPKQAKYGVTIEVKEAGRLERENTSYIDEDEIDSLIKGLEYIGRADKSITALSDFEAQYRTKGDFSISTFSDRSGEINLAATSGRIGKTMAVLKINLAADLKNALVKAQAVIAAAKQPR